MKDWAKFLSGSAVTYLFVACASSGGGLAEVVDAIGGASGLLDAGVAVGGGDDGAGGTAGPGATGGGTTGGSSSGSGGPVQSGGAADGGEGGSMLGGMMSAIVDAAVDAVTDPVPEAEAQSGERLKARWVTAADGARQFLGFYDSELGLQCTMTGTGGDEARCLPTANYIALEAFADSACSDHVIAVQCGGTRFASKAVAVAGCNDDNPAYRTEFYEIGAPYSGTLYAENATTGCTAMAETTREAYEVNYDFFRRGALVPEATFAVGAIAEE